MSELPRRKRERRKKRNQDTSTTTETDEKTNTSVTQPGAAQKNKNINRNQGPRKIERQNMTIPSKMIGFLIGHRGYSISALRDRTNCEINIYDNPNNNTTNNTTDTDSNNTNNTQNQPTKHVKSQSKDNEESKLELVGTCEEIASCRKEIQFLINNGRFMMDSERGIISKSNEKEIAIDMKIPSKVCGMLIGGKGEKVQEIMLVTGCEIWVERDNTTHIEAGVATVHLKGNKINVLAAQDEIRHVLSLWGTAGGKNASRIVFELPNYCSRQIIGENGITIKNLQTKYHCSIRIKNFKSSDYKFNPRMNKDIQNTCVITITGEPQDCKNCKYAIDELIGIYIKCVECNKYKLQNEGKLDEYMLSWYCNDCWNEYTKQQSPDGTCSNNGTNESSNNTPDLIENSPQQRQQMNQLTNQMSQLTTQSTNVYNNNNRQYNPQREYNNNDSQQQRRGGGQRQQNRW